MSQAQRSQEPSAMSQAQRTMPWKAPASALVANLLE